MKTAPVCPKCGKTLEKLRETPASAGLFAGDGDSTDVVCVYRCTCGTMFSRTEKQSEGDQEPRCQSI